MKKHLLICITALIAFNLNTAKAQQTDTAKYDLGRISIQKKFTQAVTVKGIDLQKLPFTNLNDAVNTWFYGVYGTGSYITVIDGNLINDINAYSIYDIEEITLVQNSLTHLNGISPNQILLLVKTRRGNRPGKSGIEVNGQSNLVTLRNTSGIGKSTSNFYHQYYVSRYVNAGNIQAGFSAAFQQSVNPTIENTGLQANTPYSLRRIKLNGYFEAKLNNNNSLSFNAGYAPQTDTLASNSVSASTMQSYGYHINQNVLHLDITLHSTITKGLTNTLSAGLQNYYFKEKFGYKNIVQTYPGAATTTIYNDTSSHIINYLVKDNLSYKITAGNWLIEPNVNLAFNQFKSHVYNHTDFLTYYSAPPGNISGGSQFSSVDYLQKSATLTPALAVSYGDAFLLQGGAEYFLNSTVNNPFQAQPKFSRPKLLPFASLTVNVLQSSAGNNPKTKLMAYASFAKSLVNMTDLSASLGDGTNLSLVNSALSGGYYTGYGFGYGDPNYNPYKTYDQIQAGATLSLLNSKLTISYNYSVRKYNFVYANIIAISGSTGYYGYYFLYPDQRIDLHRIGVEFKAIQNATFSWTTAFNGSVAKLNTYFSSANTGGFFSSSNSIAAGNVTTGGFINRFTYKKFTGGLDVLYRINEDSYPYFATGNTKGNTNSFDLKNVYVGYQLTPKGTKGLELFINGRNLIQNKQSDITDNRRFYGFGFKLGL